MEAGGSIADFTAAELIARIESGESVHVLDVRAPERLVGGRIEEVPEERFHNVPGSVVAATSDPSTLGIPRGKPIAVVCGRGHDSAKIAAHLRRLGLDARSLSDGMVGWMALSVPRELPPPPGWDRFVQFDRVGKAALSYLLVSGGEALVVDPPRHTDPIASAAAATGARITAVADTHAHADYISGGRALADRTGATYHLHPADAVSPFDGSPARIAYRPLEEGASIPIGRSRVTVAHTPGHTEGSVTFLLGTEVALTGDFLFVRSVGRPDLGGRAESWTPDLWRSLERARREWPRSIRIHPAHYADAQERNEDRTVGRPLAELEPWNEPFTIGSETRFTRWVLHRVGPFPAAYRRIKTINLGLESPGEEEMTELEAGRNQCALG